MTEAVIHIDKIIETLENPECRDCLQEMDAVYYFGYTDPEKRIKERPNDLSAWLCNGCKSAVYPVIDDEQLIFLYYDRNVNKSYVINALDNLLGGLKWYEEVEE